MKTLKSSSHSLNQDFKQVSLKFLSLFFDTVIFYSKFYLNNNFYLHREY